MKKTNYIALAALLLSIGNSQVSSSEIVEDVLDDNKKSYSYDQINKPTDVMDDEEDELESLIDLEEEAKLSFQNRAGKIYKKLLAERTLRNDKLKRFRISFLKKPIRLFSKIYYYDIFTEKNTINKQYNINKSLKKLSKENKIKNKMATKFINIYLDAVEGIYNEKVWEKVQRKVEEELGKDDFSYLLEAIENSYNEEGEIKLKTSNS